MLFKRFHKFIRVLPYFRGYPVHSFPIYIEDLRRHHPLGLDMFKPKPLDIPIEIDKFPLHQKVKITGDLAGLIDVPARNRRSVRRGGIRSLGFDNLGHQPFIIFCSLLGSSTAKKLVGKI